MTRSNTSAQHSSAEQGTGGDREPVDQTQLHPLAAGLVNSLANREAVTLGTFAEQLQAIHAELMLMRSQIGPLSVSDAEPGSTPAMMPSNEDADDLAAFLARR